MSSGSAGQADSGFESWVTDSSKCAEHDLCGASQLGSPLPPAGPARPVHGGRSPPRPYDLGGVRRAWHARGKPAWASRALASSMFPTPPGRTLTHTVTQGRKESPDTPGSHRAEDCHTGSKLEAACRPKVSSRPRPLFGSSAGSTRRRRPPVGGPRQVLGSRQCRADPARARRAGPPRPSDSEEPGARGRGRPVDSPNRES